MSILSTLIVIDSVNLFYIGCFIALVCIINYISVSYYIPSHKKWHAFSAYFILAYLVELLVCTLAIHILISLKGGDPGQIWLRLFDVDMLYILAFLFTGSGILRYLLYDKRHMDKGPKDTF
jgi:hypothetical protein